MSDKKIIVPQGMLKSAMECFGADFTKCSDADKKMASEVLEAALLWWSENPRVPTVEQFKELHEKWHYDELGEPSDAIEFQRIFHAWQRRMFDVPEPEIQSQDVCGACVIHFIAREGSFFPCALPAGHGGGHRAAGNCFKHGPYLGDLGSVPNCPKWPSCVELEPEVPENIGDLMWQPTTSKLAPPFPLDPMTGKPQYPDLSRCHNESVLEAYRRGKEEAKSNG